MLRHIRSVLLLAVASSVFAVSCTKQVSAPPANAKFLGTWVGSQVCNVIGDSVGTASAMQENIGVGSDNNSIVIGVAFGAGTCYQASYLTATVKNNDFGFGQQSFFDNCGKSYATRGTGVLNTAGTTLTMATYVISQSSSDSCTFIGVKQ